MTTAAARASSVVVPEQVRTVGIVRARHYSVSDRLLARHLQWSSGRIRPTNRSFLWQQRRSYWFIPTSLAELRLRMMTSFKKRTVKVKLLRDQWKTAFTAQRDRWNVLYQKQQWLQGRRPFLRTKQGPMSPTPPPPPIPTKPSSPPKLSSHLLHRPRSWVQNKRQAFQSRRRRVVQRFREQQRVRSMSIKQSVYAKTHRIRSFWHRTRRRFPRLPPYHYSNIPPPYVWSNQFLYQTKPIVLQEYSQRDWFCAHTGRPITSVDETGRFVNPWQSQSSSGVQSLRSILQWRYDRLRREFRQYGWQALLPDQLRRQVSSSNEGVTETRQSLAKVTSMPLLPPAPLPLDQLVPDAAANNQENTHSDRLRFTWLGHAMCLIQYGRINILTDPMLSERASPFQSPWIPIGIARDIPPVCSVEDLPNIDICLISHDHYDHLDQQTVRKLRSKVRLWIVPAGTEEFMRKQGGLKPEDKRRQPRQKILEMEWWESIRIKRTYHKNPNNTGRSEPTVDIKAIEFLSLSDSPALHPLLLRSQQEVGSPNVSGTLSNKATDYVWITCLPVQHWSGRNFWDRNYRHWCSYAAFFEPTRSPGVNPATGPAPAKVYFAGDTALPTDFPLFEQISDYLGNSIDIAALPIGAYEPEYFMKDAHTDPYEALQVHRVLQSRKSVGIHWGTFPLSEEPMREPPLLLQQAIKEATTAKDSGETEAPGLGDNLSDFVTIPHGASIDVLCNGDEDTTDVTSTVTDSKERDISKEV